MRSSLKSPIIDIPTAPLDDSGDVDAIDPNGRPAASAYYRLQTKLADLHIELERGLDASIAFQEREGLEELWREYRSYFCLHVMSAPCRVTHAPR